jgi:hypothetical protein
MSAATPSLHTITNDPELASMVKDAREQQAAALLDEARLFLSRFCVFPHDHALVAATLWAAHTHMIERFHTSPRLMLSSPEAGSGKTRVLEVLNLLVPEPMMSLSASPAAIFRTLSKRQITLLFDEVDAIFSKRGKDDSHEDLRALLNCGYKRGATIPRCVGPKHDVVDFPVFAAVALAGLGDLPDTIMTRAIIIRMRRRAPAESVEPFRARIHEAPGHILRDRLKNWAEEVGQSVCGAWPTLPEGIVDRPAELWEPLIAIADTAGAAWAERARSACLAICKASQDNRTSLGMRLLSDIRKIFDRAGMPDALHTGVILAALCGGDDSCLDDDAPWNELHGKPLGVRGLAAMLKPYGVNSLKVKVNGVSLQGYRREQLWDAWTRYLPPLPAQAEPVELVVHSKSEVPTKVPEVPEVPEVPDVQRMKAILTDQAEVF